MNIGVGITTRNRNEMFNESLKYFKKYLPDDASVIIVDDASSDPVEYTHYPIFRFNENVGVARAKNKCLEMLDHCDHIFLFDDDTYPITTGWWKPYVYSGENHLMYQFKLPNSHSDDMRLLNRYNGLVAYSHTRGAMLYITKKVLETVGGMDTVYGKSMFEHTDWTNRIFNAGLTTYRAADVRMSGDLIYCHDQIGDVKSSIPDKQRSDNMKVNSKIYRLSSLSSEYKEYRDE